MNNFKKALRAGIVILYFFVLKWISEIHVVATFNARVQEQIGHVEFNWLKDILEIIWPAFLFIGFLGLILSPVHWSKWLTGWLGIKADESLKDHVDSLVEIKEQLLSVVDTVDTLDKDLKRSWSKNERLSQENEYLRSLNQENSQELFKKIKAIEIVSRRQQIAKYALAFGLGLLSSVLGSIFVDWLQF